MTAYDYRRAAETAAERASYHEAHHWELAADAWADGDAERERAAVACARSWARRNAAAR